MCNHKKGVNLLGLTCFEGCLCLQFFILSLWVLCNYPNCYFLALPGFACNFGILCSIGLGKFSYSNVLLSLYLKFYISWLSFLYNFIPSTHATRGQWTTVTNSCKLFLLSLICDLISTVHPSLICAFVCLCSAFMVYPICKFSWTTMNRIYCCCFSFRFCYFVFF